MLNGNLHPSQKFVDQYFCKTAIGNDQNWVQLENVEKCMRTKSGSQTDQLMHSMKQKTNILVPSEGRNSHLLLVLSWCISL